MYRLFILSWFHSLTSISFWFKVSSRNLSFSSPVTALCDVWEGSWAWAESSFICFLSQSDLSDSLSAYVEWQKVCESWTSEVWPSQRSWFKRSAASGDKNGSPSGTTKMHTNDFIDMLFHAISIWYMYSIKLYLTSWSRIMVLFEVLLPFLFFYSFFLFLFAIILLTEKKKNTILLLSLMNVSLQARHSSVNYVAPVHCCLHVNQTTVGR